VLTASTESDLEVAFATMVQQRIGALTVMPDPFFVARRDQLVALAARYEVPGIYPLREFVEVGGLMSYGSRLADLYQLVGTHTGKILRGAWPKELAFES
jgi:putative ABC transport system substrate-binding protein